MGLRSKLARLRKIVTSLLLSSEHLGNLFCVIRSRHTRERHGQDQALERHGQMYRCLCAGSTKSVIKLGITGGTFPPRDATYPSFDKGGGLSCAEKTTSMALKSHGELS